VEAGGIFSWDEGYINERTGDNFVADPICRFYSFCVRKIFLRTNPAVQSNLYPQTFEVFRGATVTAIRPLLCLLAVSLLSILTACGGGGGGSTVPVVQISGQSSTIAPNGSFSLSASVTGDSTNSGVTWTINPASGSGALTNSTPTSVTYTAPGTVPTNPNVTITATSIANSQGAQSVSFIIQQPAVQVPGDFKGQYAFVMSGFDSSGNPLTVGGSVKADGNGNITTGVIDVNDNGSNASVTSINGTYTLDTNGRGTIKINNALQAFSSTPTFSYTIDTGTNTGAMISLDSSLAAVSGTIDQQSNTVFGEIPSGSFIFRGFSDNPQRASEVGRVSIVGGGAISNGVIDISDILNGNDFTDTTLTGGGVGNFTAADSNGRGTFGWVPAGGTAANHVYYAVSATKIYFLENDNITPTVNTQFVGQLRTQSLASLSASSPNGSGIFGTIGGDLVDDDGVSEQFSSVGVGNLNISGTGVSANWDLNDASYVTSSTGSGTGPVSGTVAFDATTGRGTLTFSNGFANGFIDSAVFYLQSNGTGVVMDTTSSTSGGSYPESLVGDLTPQSNVSALAGNIQGVELISECDIPVFDTAGVINSGNLTALQDGAVSNCNEGGGTVSSQALTGTFGSVGSTGRSVVEINSASLPFDQFPGVAYAIDATHFYVIQAYGSTSSINGLTSSLAVYWTQTLPVAPASANFVPTKNASPTVAHRMRPQARKSRTNAGMPRPSNENQQIK
jgi:hypothetical protein